MAQNAGVVLPKDLAELVTQRTQTWSDHDEATRSANQLEHLAPKVPEGTPTMALQPLSRSGQPPDELAGAVESLQRELKGIGQLQQDLQAAERRRFNAIVTGVVIAVVVVVLFVVLAVCGLGGLLKGPR